MFVVHSTSIVGDSHIGSGRGNEDSLFVGRGNSGWLACVVSDGCGSAKHAAIGSKLIAELVGEALLRVSTRIDQKGVGGWITDDIISELANCKNKLRDVVGPELNHYHATVVAALVSPKGGFLLHIGDGIATNIDLQPTDSQVLEWSQGITSEPENGEYANETFYLTEPNWIRHFRITPLPNVGVLMLCTDGAQDVLFDRNQINAQQLQIILESAKDRSSSANLALRDHLQGDEARKRSSDDKTVALILADQVALSLRSAKVLRAKSGSIPTQTSPAPVRSEKAMRQKAVGQQDDVPKSYVSGSATGHTQAPVETKKTGYLMPMGIFAILILGLGLGYGIANVMRPLSQEKSNASVQTTGSSENSDAASKSNQSDVSIPEKNVVSKSAQPTSKVCFNTMSCR